ncbi:helix-turn-helix domain-containing protein [Heyndrickxia sporothermodurans]|uniref:helix-turn-helix domain-containing protein n=1 Tax=Heyndrickxia sporothermodurans TaxID=46224 RepID=UPI0035DCA80C
MKVGYVKNLQNNTTPMEIIEGMKKEGVEKIIVELSSDQDSYQKMLFESIETMVSKDILVINALDDLGESLLDIISVVEKLDEKDIGIRLLSSLNSNIDFNIKEFMDDWDIQRLLRKQLLLVLIWVENKEKNDIRKRQIKGMETMKALKNQKGSGRPKKYSKYAKDPEDRKIYHDTIHMLDNEIPIKRIAETLNISRNTIYTIRDEYLKNGKEH